MSNPIKTEPMTVIGLEVDSYKRLRAAELHPAATGLVPVKGRNAAGKSSLIGSMLEALGVEKSKLPITEGQHGAQVVMDLGEIVVKVRWGRDSAGKAKRSLIVESADGSRIKSPQATLDMLCGQFADPVAFLSLKPIDQVKTVLAVTGLDKELSVLAGEEQQLYERRRDLGRDAERSMKFMEGLRANAVIDERIDALDPLDGAISVEALADELETAHLKNSEIESVDDEIARLESEGKIAAHRVEQAKAHLAEWEAESERLRGRWVSTTERRRSMIPIPVEPIMQQLASIEEVKAYRQAKKELADAESEAAHDAEAHTIADDMLSDCRSRIAALLGGAEFPVDGMTYDHEAKVLLVGGIPFAQASQAEQLKAAASIAMAGDPSIRVIFAREGSLLDAESQRVLAEAAEAAGFQLWLEIVSETAGGTGVWIEDGQAVDVVPPAAG